MIQEDFAKPQDLSADGEKAYAIIEEWRTKRGYNFTGGCPLYKSPKEWEDRGEEYGTDSVLVLVHDGGDFSCHETSSGLSVLEESENLRVKLAAAGFYLEACTVWYHAVYKDT